MAALMALEEAGLSDAFDHVIGSSAGAINGAYFLAQQAKLAVTVYLDDISNKRFINFLRLKKTVDIDYLIDEVLKRHKALDVEKVRAARSLLHIILTDYEACQPFTVTNRDIHVDLMEALRATAAMPLLYNRSIQIGGRHYIDGGVSDLLPLHKAIELGCTDILVVLTCPPGFRRWRLRGATRLLIGALMRTHPRQMKAALLSEDARFNRAMDWIEDPKTAPRGARIAAVFPSNVGKMVSRVTANRRLLLACALMARNDARVALKLPPKMDDPWKSS